jgi:hypothetical protein
MLTLIDSRKNNNIPQIWCAGCSISHGVGIQSNEKYGVLLADALAMPISFLTTSGSSIEWAADQICRSDICKGDIVVWGITSHYRLSYYESNCLYHIHSSMYIWNSNWENKIPLSRLDSDDNFYHQLTDVFKVINFCRKVGAILILANMLDDFISDHIKNQPGFIQLIETPNREPAEMFMDLGIDKVHPGPVTHQYYSKEILKKIKELQ